MLSLRSRLMLAAGIVLVTFVVLTGLALNRAFSVAAIHAQEAKLRGLTYALLGAAYINPHEASVSLPQLGDPRLQQPGSGFYAMIADTQGHVIWSSPSLLTAPARITPSKVNTWRFERKKGPEGGHFQLDFGVRWTPNSGGRYYTFVVGEPVAGYLSQLAEFRRTLIFWLGAATVLLLLTLAAVLQWGLKPLRNLSVELARVEQGDAVKIAGRYPGELSRLVSGLNTLLIHERARQTRYRHALADLAHSLKTPLAVLRGLNTRDGLNEEAERRVSEQVGRMDQIVAYQLNRANAGSMHGLMPPVMLAPLVKRVIATLRRVYQERNLTFDAKLPEELKGRVNENDMLEIVGNLLDNAAKWAKSRVIVHLHREERGLVLTVEDDGPGFDPDETEYLLKRGTRADTQVEGHGIGLAVVGELVRSYGGKIEIHRAESGGASVTVSFPEA